MQTAFRWVAASPLGDPGEPRVFISRPVCPQLVVFCCLLGGGQRMSLFMLVACLTAGGLVFSILFSNPHLRIQLLISERGRGRERERH